MPIILIGLALGLIVAAASGIYLYRNPTTNKPESTGTPLLVLGIVFLVGGSIYVLMGSSVGYSWAPIGIVFLGVGARQRRQHRAG